MLAHADMDDTRAARRARRDRAHLRRHPRRQAGRRADPLRGRPGRRGRPDLKRQLPGRGVWVTATARRVDEAVKRKAFRARLQARGARRRPISATQVERLLERAALDALAHRQQGRPGRDRLRQGRGGARPDDRWRRSCQASDGGAGRGAQARGAPRRRQTAGIEGEIPIIAAFTTAQLDLALGRSNVIHAALLAGPASNGFLARCQSLERFRTIAPDGRGTG